MATIWFLSGCHHKAPYVEPPPSWRWADVGTVCTVGSPTYSLPETLRDTTVHPFGMAGKNEWEHRARITQSIPGGFGGIGLRRVDPHTVVYLVDTTQLSAAVPALVGLGLLPPNPRVAAVQGRWTYSQLYDWMRYIHMRIRGVRVTLWTLDDYRNRIYYGVEDEAAATDLGRRLAEMHAPCFLVAVDVTGPVRLTALIKQLPPNY